MNGVFISYVKENKKAVCEFYQNLKSHDINVWLDRNEIDPGARWKHAIRKAIREGAYFVACFSKEYNDRDKTYMNEELIIAIEELRQRPNDRIWFIPVKLNDCEIPDRNIGGGETLQDLQYVNLYEDWDSGIQRILKVVQSAVPEPDVAANANELGMNRDAEAEYSKGLECQNTVTETTPPGEKLARIKKAMGHYAKALKLKPDYVDAWNARGAVHAMMGRIDQSIKDFSMAIKLQPDYFVAYLNRGGVHMRDGRYQQALKDFGKVIELKPNVYAGFFQRGEVYRLKGDFDRAIADYDRAIQLKPDLADMYNNRGIAYVNKGDFDRAIVDYTEAIELKLDNAIAYFNRGVTRLRLREWEEAKSDLNVGKAMGKNVSSLFHQDFESVSDFERRNGVEVPEDIAAMLTN